MGKVAVLVRIMPADESVDIDRLVSKIKEGLPTRIELASVKVEPFVYGINAINALFTMPDEEGYLGRLEDYLRGLEDVGELDISGISRL